MLLPMSPRFGMAIQGLLKEANRLAVYSAPTIRPKFGWNGDPGSNFAFEQGLDIRPNSVRSGRLIAGEAPIGNIRIGRLNTGWRG